MKILIITGPPYSGKGTQCRILKEKFGYNHISTGDQCRIEKENNTVIGKIMSEYEEKGDLVPDAIIKDLFEKIIDKNLKGEGIILDGYPRTISQVKDLIKLVTLKELKIKKVVHINVPHNELLVRAQKEQKHQTELMIKMLEFIRKELRFINSLHNPQLNL